MSSEEKYDIWRHSPVRYLGYANEVGEAFRYQLSTRNLILAYIISASYVAGDSIDKTYKSYNKNNRIADLKLFKTFAISLSWQILATEILPGLFVFLVVKQAKKFQYQSIKNTKIRYWMPTIIGLCFIPIFPYTIDPIVDEVFNKLNIKPHEI